MAIRAGFLRRQARVGLMTIGAHLVPLRRALLFGTMTAGARSSLFSGVRLMAADAARVTCFDQPRLTLVAVIAADFVVFRMVR